MFELGSAADWTRDEGIHHGGTFWGGEAVLDFMFWPKRNIGWYVKPGYESVWRTGGRHQGMEMAIGLLIGR